MQLLKLGSKVIAVSRSEEHLQDLHKDSNSKALRTIQLDLRDWKRVRQVLTEQIPDGQLDGLVNNAGVAVIKPFYDMKETDLDE